MSYLVFLFKMAGGLIVFGLIASIICLGLYKWAKGMSK